MSCRRRPGCNLGLQQVRERVYMCTCVHAFLVNWRIDEKWGVMSRLWRWYWPCVKVFAASSLRTSDACGAEPEAASSSAWLHWPRRFEARRVLVSRTAGLRASGRFLRRDLGSMGHWPPARRGFSVLFQPVHGGKCPESISCCPLLV